MTFDIDTFRKTKTYEGLITGVYFGTQLLPADSTDDDVPSNVYFDLVVKTESGLVTLNRVQTCMPRPADDYLLWGARPASYVGFVVPVLKAPTGFFPMIQWMPGTEVCDGDGGDGGGGGDPPPPPPPPPPGPQIDTSGSGGSVDGFGGGGVLNE